MRNDAPQLTPHPSEPFPLRGVIEGFYGTFYHFPERNDLIRFLGQNDFNFYLYGPKNDRQHRMRWWDPYPAPVLDDFEDTIALARENGLEFCYAISFGVPMQYGLPQDYEVITGKLRKFYDRGCRSFGILLDDITDGFVHEVNRRAFRNVAQAHALCSNRVYEWAQTLDPSCKVYLCPGEYHGTPPFSEYLYDLGRQLHREIEVLYTGPDICSREITVEHVRDVSEVLNRPTIIWDNYPVNDLHMRYDMHIGPLLGRDPDLGSVCRGYVANVMNQKEASKIPLLTAAEYLRDPWGYDPEVAWERALQAIGGESYPQLRLFAMNSLGSCLRDDDAPVMDLLISNALRSLDADGSTHSHAVLDFEAHLDTLDEACYHLKNRMRNLELRQNLLPWIEALEERIWMGRGAIRTLRAIESGIDCQAPLRFMESLVLEVDRVPRRLASPRLMGLVQYARAAAARTGRAAIPVHGEIPAGIAALESAMGETKLDEDLGSVHAKAGG